MYNFKKSVHRYQRIALSKRKMVVVVYVNYKIYQIFDHFYIQMLTFTFQMITFTFQMLTLLKKTQFSIFFVPVPGNFYIPNVNFTQKDSIFNFLIPVPLPVTVTDFNFSPQEIRLPLLLLLCYFVTPFSRQFQ